MLLEVKGLNTFYGNLHAIWDIDIQVHEKEIVALIGSNGAGKSTLLKTIAGSLPMQSGEIIYQGERFNPGHKRKANVMVHKGITLCPEGRHIFPRMTVAENLKMGGYIRQKGDMEAGFDRRRAADAGHRPGADERAKASHAGRAVPGAFALADGEAV